VRGSEEENQGRAETLALLAAQMDSNNNIRERKGAEVIKMIMKIK